MYFIINKSTRELIRQSQSPFNIDDKVQPPLPAFQLKGVEDATVPAFDANTHRLNRTFVDDDTAATRTFKNEVVPLTAPQLAAIAKRISDEAQRQQIKTIYAALVAGTGTAAERLVRLEKSVAYLLKDSLN